MAVTCLSCVESVGEGSQALQCDVCNKWAHTECVGVTKQAYKLAGKLEGFQWFCPKCLEDWKSMQPLVLDIASEIRVLQGEASKVPQLECTLTELQSTMKELAGVIDFISSDSSIPSASPSSLPMGLDLHIPESQNRFALLQHLDDHSSTGLAELDNPTPQENPEQTQTTQLILGDPCHIEKSSSHNTPCSHTPCSQPETLTFDRSCPSTNTVADRPIEQAHPATAYTTDPSIKQAEQPHNIRLHKYFIDIRAIPSHIRVEQVKSKLQSLNIPHDYLTEPIYIFPNTTRKYLEIDLKLDDANRLHKALKNDSSLRWFVSIFPPNRSRPVPPMSQNLPPITAANIPQPVPPMSLRLPPLTAANKPQPVPPMSLRLPPLTAANKPRTVPPMSLRLPPLTAANKPQPVPLMSQRLPPLTAANIPRTVPPMSLSLPPLTAANRPRPVPLMSLKLPPLTAAYVNGRVQISSKTSQPKPTECPFLGQGKRVYSRRIAPSASTLPQQMSLRPQYHNLSHKYNQAQILPTLLC